MEGKYFFNGKDISMNLYIQIRDVVDQGVIHEVHRRRGPVAS